MGVRGVPVESLPAKKSFRAFHSVFIFPYWVLPVPISNFGLEPFQERLAAGASSSLVGWGYIHIWAYIHIPPPTDVYK